MRAPSSLAGKIAVGLIGTLLVVTVALGAAVATGAFAPPTVESVENSWGEVTEDTTEIESAIVVHNPNPVGLPAIVDVGAGVEMNGVEMAPASTQSVGFGTGNSTIELTTELDNGKIPEWWATHVNEGERTTVTIKPTVSAPFFSPDVPARTSTFETDLLGEFESDERSALTVDGRELLAVTGTTASWGTADAERTPFTLAATLRNDRDRSITIDRVGYNVTMNGIRVAGGSADGVTVAPNAAEELAIDASLDTTLMDEWWVSHVRNGESTTLSVDAYAVVTANGEERRVPIPSLDKSVQFETDVLGN